jgi:hypothetical protein
MGGEGRSGGRGTSGRAPPKASTAPSFRKDCEALGQSLKRAWGGADGEREKLENPGSLLEKRATLGRWLNPGLPIRLPGPRPNPPAREPKELILCPAQGIPQTTMTKPTRRQIRGGNVHLLCNKFFSFSDTNNSADGQPGCHGNVKFWSSVFVIHDVDSRRAAPVRAFGVDPQSQLEFSSDLRGASGA